MRGTYFPANRSSPSLDRLDWSKVPSSYVENEVQLQGLSSPPWLEPKSNLFSSVFEYGYHILFFISLSIPSSFDFSGTVWSQVLHHPSSSWQMWMVAVSFLSVMPDQCGLLQTLSFSDATWPSMSICGGGGHTCWWLLLTLPLNKTLLSLLPCSSRISPPQSWAIHFLTQVNKVTHFLLRFSPSSSFPRHVQVLLSTQKIW